MAAEPGLRAFLDTNVLFSRVYSAQGTPGIILARFVLGEFTLVISQHVLAEILRVFQQKLSRGLVALQGVLLGSGLEVVADPPKAVTAHWSGMLDPEDAVILEAAVAARVDYFVTGDRHFLEDPAIAEQSGLAIVSPAEFLAELQRRQDI